MIPNYIDRCKKKKGISHNRGDAPFVDQLNDRIAFTTFPDFTLSEQ